MRLARGFTLIELMIAVVVVAILASIAYPSYQSYMTRARRSDAQQLMLEISSRQAQYILDARSYADKIGAAGLNISREGWTCGDTCTNAYYAIAVVPDNADTPPSYVITGTPAGTQAGDGTLTLDSTGSKARVVSGTDKGW